MNAILEPWYQKWGRKRGKKYMDDIGISMSRADKAIHIEMVHDLFHILTTHGLHLKLSKSVLFTTTNGLPWSMNIQGWRHSGPCKSCGAQRISSGPPQPQTSTRIPGMCRIPSHVLQKL